MSWRNGFEQGFSSGFTYFLAYLMIFQSWARQRYCKTLKDHQIMPKKFGKKWSNALLYMPFWLILVTQKLNFGCPIYHLLLLVHRRDMNLILDTRPAHPHDPKNKVVFVTHKNIQIILGLANVLCFGPIFRSVNSLLSLLRTWLCIRRFWVCFFRI